MGLLRSQSTIGLTSVLLVSSTGCGTCTGFKPTYVELEQKINNFCTLYIIEAESVGGRRVLREGFEKHLGKRYDGFPSLFVIGSGDVREIPYETIWSKELKRFDTEGITTYIKKYLFERGLL